MYMIRSSALWDIGETPPGLSITTFIDCIRIGGNSHDVINKGDLWRCNKYKHVYMHHDWSNICIAMRENDSI